MPARGKLRVADLMTRIPVRLAPTAPQSAVDEVFEDDLIHHLPVVEGDRTVGLWVRTPDDATVLHDAESVGRATPGDSPESAIDQLFEGKEAVLVWEGDEPVGILTRSDVRRLITRAVEVGLGRRASRPPLIVRFYGPRYAGKTTLIMRTLPLIRHGLAGVVDSGDPPEDFDRVALEGSPAVYGHGDEARSGLDQAIKTLGDVQIVLFEDHAEDDSAPDDAGEDLRIIVIPVTEAPRLKESALDGAHALVITKLDLVPEFDLVAFSRRMVATHPDLEVVGVAAAIDDRGLDRWRRWLQRNYLPRLHWP
jgi:Ni2+-binding GTPase involved in maturation of urease and hydrogenase